MSSLSVNLPLRRDSDDGYVMLKRVKGMIKQNFKMLLLTIPGERVMIPEYGVGLPKFLFELHGSNLEQSISSKTRQQVDIYMPYLRLENLEFSMVDGDRNSMQIEITYSVPSLNFRDLLSLTI